MVRFVTFYITHPIQPKDRTVIWRQGIILKVGGVVTARARHIRCMFDVCFGLNATCWTAARSSG